MPLNEELSFQVVQVHSRENLSRPAGKYFQFELVQKVKLHFKPSKLNNISSALDPCAVG